MLILAVYLRQICGEIKNGIIEALLKINRAYRDNLHGTLAFPRPTVLPSTWIYKPQHYLRVSVIVCVCACL